MNFSANSPTPSHSDISGNAEPTVKVKKPRKKKLVASQLDLLITTIIKALDDNKAEEIIRIDLKERSLIADEMIIASGLSTRHVMALADYVSEALIKAGFPTPSDEGREAADWILLDAGDVIVHIFRPEIRSLYNLEKLWGPMGS